MFQRKRPAEVVIMGFDLANAREVYKVPSLLLVLVPPLDCPLQNTHNIAIAKSAQYHNPWFALGLMGRYVGRRIYTAYTAYFIRRTKYLDLGKWIQISDNCLKI